MRGVLQLASPYVNPLYRYREFFLSAFAHNISGGCTAYHGVWSPIITQYLTDIDGVEIFFGGLA